MLFQAICQTGKASFQLFVIPLICSVVIITLKIKGMGAPGSAVG